MTDTPDGLLNLSSRELALLAERARAAPYQCFLSEPIAIIGMACRFPGAANPEQFWQLLLSGRGAVTEVPADRWDVDACYDPDPQAPGKTYSRWGGFLDRVDEFDAAFFGISPREARQMDPRQRLLLETAWEALENAGQAPERLAGSDTGVFIGHMVGDYYALETRNAAGIDAHVGTGNLDSILANRLSYALNLQGPSLAVDTACSSSLVALYLACQSLRQDECRTAIAGGVNLMLTPEMHVIGAKALLLSPDGRCRTFDRDANGFVRGEGCGVLVLKRLADALAAGDNVQAVIRGVAVNQDGRTNGLSAPNGLSQQRVIRRALRNALLEPSSVTFVETHGTGTVVGDTIEFEALAETYGRPGASGPCYLGAVKTNIGHLEGAAGAAGVIKMVLCLRHGRMPPNVNFSQVNPHLAIGPTRLRLPLEVTEWSITGGSRRGAVSSFGLGGTNGHAILEEPPPVTAAAAAVERPLHVLALSARDGMALRELARRYEAFLAGPCDVSLPDMAFTANTGRNHFAHRAAIVADSLATLHARLAQAGGGRAAESPPQIAFLFSGGAAQSDGAGRELCETQPAFRRALDECNPRDGDPQARLFALEYALAQLWRSWGIEPALGLGDGVGACVAECLNGTLGLEDGLRKCATAGADTEESLAARIRDLHEQGCNVFVEVGPGSGLIDLGRTAVTDPSALWLRSLDPRRPEWQQMLESLAALYERGVAVDWAGFDREYARRKVALPTYPFRRERYWLEACEAPADLVYRLAWRPKPFGARTAPAYVGDWLIVAPKGGLGDQLAVRLGRSGQRARTAAESRPSGDAPYRGVVYLAAAAPDADAAAAEAASVGLLRLLQSLGDEGGGARLWVVTRGSQAVTGKEPIRPAEAALWGLARTVRLEHPELQCVTVDLDPETEDLGRLTEEMLSPGEPQVAYRAGTRYVARLVRDGGEPGRAPPIRPTGCYLITGGLGALGLRLARHLVDQGARHLVLAGRNARADDPAVEALGAAGASVLVVHADVARAEDVERLVAACQACGPLRGVVHAAGVLDDGILDKQTPERFARVLAPKVRGAWELHLRTRDLPLDFFVCFSSLTSLLGSPGQGNYAAANAFLDALAHHRRAAGLRGLSINWGPWAEAGMAARLHSRLEAHGETPLDPGVGVRSFTAALARGGAQIGVMRVDWPRYAATYPAPEFLEELVGNTPGPALLERLQEAPADRQPELLEEFVRSELARVLGHAQGTISRREGFAALGLDSLGAIELRTRLEQALGCRLPATLAFDHPTVEALVAHLLERLPPRPTADDPPRRTGDLDDLTRDELAALLASELGTPPEGNGP
jgi:acyl transferase domain-containing protein/acyl carrier protein